jgi:multiple sugar transport system substrate-binding protein
MNSKLLSRREFLRLGALASAGLALAACQPAAPPTEEPVEEEPVEEEPAEVPAGELKYEGVELSVAGMSWVWERAEEIYGEFLEETGMTLSVAQFGQQEITDKLMQSVAAGVYLADFIGILSNVTADVWGNDLCEPVPDHIINDPAMDWEDVMPIYREKVLTWGGTVYGLPFDGDTHNTYWNSAPVDDPDNQEAFLDKYGYELDNENGPATWEEWRDWGEFFSETDWNGEGTGVGFTLCYKRGDTGFWGYMGRTAAYAKHPDDPGFFWDTDTGEPRINNPAFIRALEEMTENLPFTLESGVNTGFGDALEGLKTNRVVIHNGWPDPGSFETEDSLIRGLIRFGQTPGSREVYNAREGQWDTFDEIQYAPYLSAGGWCFSVAKGCPNLDAAFEFGLFICNRENGNRMAYLKSTNPLRFSAYADTKPWVDSMGMSQESAESYIKALNDTLTHPNLTLNLRMPGWTQYRDSIELAMSKALTGEASAQAAMDECYDTWVEIGERLGGMDLVKENYRTHLGL